MDKSALRACLCRISWLFDVPGEDLDQAWEFGCDLRPSFVSDWRENEVDQLLVDVQEMQARLGKRSSRSEPVLTVGGYCALAVEFKEVDPNGYRRLVRRWDKEARMRNASPCRRMIYKVIGI